MPLPAQKARTAKSMQAMQAKKTRVRAKKAWVKVGRNIGGPAGASKAGAGMKEPGETTLGETAMGGMELGEENVVKTEVKSEGETGERTVSESHGYFYRMLRASV